MTLYQMADGKVIVLDLVISVGMTRLSESICPGEAVCDVQFGLQDSPVEVTLAIDNTRTTDETRAVCSRKDRALATEGKARRKHLLQALAAVQPSIRSVRV